MTIELVTGHAGSAHISAADAGALNAGIVGSGEYVFSTANQFSCTVQSANLVSVATGDALFEGRHVRITTTEQVAIDNGAQGVNRNDIICIKYANVGGVESATLEVVKGTAVSGTPSDPTIPSGSIISGSSTAYMRLWRIPIEGISVGTPEKLFGEALTPLKTIGGKTWNVAQIPNLPASKITSGTFDEARIPEIPASKVSSGTFDAAQIPNIPASKVTSGTFDTARIPNMSADKITSGVFPYARIPWLPAEVITSGVFPVSRGGTGKSSGTCYMADTLYTSSGSNGNITLSSSAANYTILEIFFRDNDNHYNSTKVYSPNGKIANLSMTTNISNGQCNYKRREVTINGTAVNTQSYGEQDGGAAATSTNNIYIYAVIGYK